MRRRAEITPSASGTPCRGPRSRGSSSGTQAVTRPPFSPDETRVVTSDSDGRVGVFAVPSGKRVRWLVSGRSSPATDAVFSPDGTLVAAGALDGTVHIWRADTGEAIATMRHSDTVWTVSFSPDSRLLVSAGSDSTARVWDSQTGLAVAALVGHDKAVRWATFGQTAG